MTAILKVIKPTNDGREFLLVKSPTLIGRSSRCDFIPSSEEDGSVVRHNDKGLPVFNVDELSRRHARLSEIEGEWRIEDLGSTNGVKVNGAKVAQTILHNGDQIALGSFMLKFNNQQIAEKEAHLEEGASEGTEVL